MPFVVVEQGETACRRRRAADDMHQDVDAAEAITDRVRDDRAAFGGGHIRRDEQLGVEGIGGHAGLAQSRHHRGADPLGAAGDERPASLQLEVLAHERISSEVILSSSISKLNWRSMGLPGKLPVRRLVTMVLPSL